MTTREDLMEENERLREIAADACNREEHLRAIIADLIVALGDMKLHGHWKYCPSLSREVECSCGYDAATSLIRRAEDLLK